MSLDKISQEIMSLAKKILPLARELEQEKLSPRPKRNTAIEQTGEKSGIHGRLHGHGKCFYKLLGKVPLYCKCSSTTAESELRVL